MSIYRYNYSLLPGLEQTGVLVPIIPVTFIHTNREISTFALVDSGAEQAVISTVIAQELEIDWRSYPKKIGFATSGQFIFHTIPKVIASIEEYEFQITINVVEGINAFKCILGRKDIFQRAKITFEGYKKQFSVEFREQN